MLYILLRICYSYSVLLCYVIVLFYPLLNFSILLYFCGISDTILLPVIDRKKTGKSLHVLHKLQT